MTQKLEKFKLRRFYNQNEILSTRKTEDGKYYIKPNNIQVNRAGGNYLFKEDDCIQIGDSEVYIADIFKSKMSIQDVITLIKQTKMRLIPLNWIKVDNGKIKLLSVISDEYCERSIAKKNISKRSSNNCNKITKQFLIDENYDDEFYGDDEEFTLEEEKRIANYVFKNSSDFFKEFTQVTKDNVINTVRSSYINGQISHLGIYICNNFICVDNSDDIDIYAIYKDSYYESNYENYFSIYNSGDKPTSWVYELAELIKTNGERIIAEDN